MRVFVFLFLMMIGAALGETQVTLSEISLGESSAPVVIEEYSSITCAHCANFHKTVLPDLRKKYIDTGKVRWVVRDFPIDGVALKLAAVIHCRGGEAVESLRACLIDQQDKWIAQKDPLAAAASLLLLKGVSKDDFKKATENQEVINALVAQRYAMEGKIEGTPTFFVNGKVYNGAYRLEGFSQAIDAALDANVQK